MTKVGRKVKGDDPQAPVDFHNDQTTLAPPVGRFIFCYIFCPLIIFETTRRILTKFDTEVKVDDPKSPVDFSIDWTTYAPPVGHFIFSYALFCPLIIFETALRILMRFGTEVKGDDLQVAVDFGTNQTTLAPPVSHFMFRYIIFVH